MNWQEQLNQLVKYHFSKLGVNYTPNLDSTRCVIDFLNVRMKAVSRAQRSVFVSDTMRTCVISPDKLEALLYIQGKIERGEDITYHLSRNALNPSFNDYLINEWVIHHIHLSKTKSKLGDPFYDRSGYLLFAIFSPNQAFFIDILRHDEKDVFSRQELLEIIDRNWPILLKKHTHPDSKFLTKKYTDSEVGQLRKKGYSVGATQINGKTIFNPGSGIVTSGHNAHLVQQAQFIVLELHQTFELIENNAEEIRKFLAAESGASMQKMDLGIHLSEKWPFFIAYERNSGMYLDSRNEGELKTLEVYSTL